MHRVDASVTTHASRRAARVPNAVLAIALLALGALGHFGHHLLDPTCVDGGTPFSHPCASCSVLHGAAIAEHHVAIEPSCPSRPSELRLPEKTAPRAAIPLRCAPRAPPLG
jgi:hypothetical protein